MWLLLLLSCAQAPSEVPADAPMDGLPAASRVVDGRRVVIRHGGDLSIDGRPVDDQVLPPVAVHGDRVAYSRLGETDGDLWLYDGAPRRLTDWEGSEDRPAFSPDGRQLAFVSGRTGLASVWVLDLETGATRQLTNVGVTPTPGARPDGFVPPPEDELVWKEELSWTAEGRTWRVTP